MGRGEVDLGSRIWGLCIYIRLRGYVFSIFFPLFSFLIFLSTLLIIIVTVLFFFFLNCKTWHL